MKNKNQSLWCAVLMAAVLFFTGADVSGELVGLWEFSNSSNFGQATVGQNLVLTGSELGVDGIGAGDGAVRLGSGAYYKVTNPIGANGGGTMTNQWTLLYDFRYGKTRNYCCLLQTDPVARANDGELFARYSGAIGIGSYSAANLLGRYEWHRLIVRANNGSFYETWVDGVKVLSQVKAIDSTHALQSVFYLRCDDTVSGGIYTEEEDVDFSTVALWDCALREDQIVALGGSQTPFTADRFDVTSSDGSAPSVDVTEGATSDSYTLNLLRDPAYIGDQAWPTSSVTVTLATDGQVAVSPATVVFPAWTGDPNDDDPNDYEVTITVTPVDDAAQEGDHMGTVSHTAVSADSRWNAYAIKDVAVSITDNDGPAAVILSKNNLWVGEGCDPNDQFTCQLYSRPAAGQTVTININAGSQCIAKPSSLVFTASDWYIPQSVTIQAIDDSVVEGTHFSTIGLSIVSGDPDYAAISIPANVAIGDNDAQGPAVIAALPAIWYNENSAMNRDAARLATNGQAVDLWEDLSGNRRYAQSLTTRGIGYPVFDAAAGAVRFEQNHPLQSAFTAIPQPMTIFVATNVSTMAGDPYVFDSLRSANRTLMSVVTSTGKWQCGAGTYVQPAPVNVGIMNINTMTCKGANSSIRINGSQVHAGNIGTKPLDGISVGMYPGSTVNNRYLMRGTINEILVYPQVLSASDVAAVEEYLAEKWTVRLGIIETSSSTELKSNVSTDTYQVFLYGAPTANVDVTITPAGDYAAEVDLGNGPGQPIVIQFTPTDFAAKTVTVTASGPITGTVRYVTLGHTAASADLDYNARSRDLLVKLTGGDPYCGQTGTVYNPVDLNKDCYVGIDDLGVLAINWLDCTDPADQANCILP